MNEQTEEVYNSMLAFEESLNSLGELFYSDEFSAELLAWFSVCGGNNEMAVINRGLHAALMISAKKFGIKGGCTPDYEKLARWTAKRNELEKAISDADNQQKKLLAESPDKPVTVKPEFPAWLHKIVDRYQLRTPEKGIDF